MKTEFKSSYPKLWRITESNGAVQHHRLFELLIMEHENGKGLLLIVLWWSFAIAFRPPWADCVHYDENGDITFSGGVKGGGMSDLLLGKSPDEYEYVSSEEIERMREKGSHDD